MLAKGFDKAKKKVEQLKDDLEIKTFRINEMKKQRVFSPVIPTVPVISIAGKNMGPVLMKEVFSEKKIQMPSNKGKEKLMKRVQKQN